MTEAERNGIRLAYDQAKRRQLPKRGRLPRPQREERARRRRLRAAISMGGPVSQNAQMFGVLAMLNQKTTSGRAATSVESCAALPTGGKAT